MTAKNRLSILIFVALTLFTVLSIYLAYDADVFFKWPFLRYSIMMSILTFLWSHAYNDDTKVGRLIIFAVCIVPIEIILLYPGLAVLGVNSDSNLASLVFFQTGIHTTGFYVIEKYILMKTGDSCLLNDGENKRNGD